MFLPISSDYHPTDATWLANATAMKFVQPHQWVEVTHCPSLSEEAAVSGSALWMYVAPGSGLWINVGVSVAFEVDREFARAPAPGAPGMSNRDAAVAAAAINASVDSLQLITEAGPAGVVELAMTGDKWPPLAGLTGAELARRGILKCGSSPTNLHECSTGDTAMRLNDKWCQEENGSHGGGVDGKQYLSDARVIEVTHARVETIPSLLDLKAAENPNRQSIWQQCSTPLSAAPVVLSEAEIEAEIEAKLAPGASSEVRCRGVRARLPSCSLIV